MRSLLLLSLLLLGSCQRTPEPQPVKQTYRYNVETPAIRTTYCEIWHEERGLVWWATSDLCPARPAYARVTPPPDDDRYLMRLVHVNQVDGREEYGAFLWIIVPPRPGAVWFDLQALKER